MKDELIAIQEDLDAVLARLAEYMSQDERHSGHEPDYEVTKEDAARVVFQYAASRDAIEKYAPNLNIETSIHQVRYSRSHWRDIDQQLVKEHGEKPGRLIAAISALADWNLSSGHPPENHHMEDLWEAAYAFLDKSSEFFGEEANLPLNPKRHVDRKKHDRHNAAMLAWEIHSSDPDAYPVGEALFEKAGAVFGMSASVVKRAYYTEDLRMTREAFNSSLSKSDEN